MVPVEISLLDETCRTKAEYSTHESFTTFAREFSFSAYSKGKDYRVTAEPCKPLKWKETMMKTDTFQLEIKNQALKKQSSRNEKKFNVGRENGRMSCQSSSTNYHILKMGKKTRTYISKVSNNIPQLICSSLVGITNLTINDFESSRSIFVS